METWIDEGLSSAAEWVYAGGHLQDRVSWFNENGSEAKQLKGKIDAGNNFYVWNNRVTPSDPYPVLDDYATVYLFFQWLRLQSDVGIYKEIIKSSDYDYNAVIKAFNATKTTGANYLTWEPMLKDWLAANAVNSATGRDGYKNDALLKNIKATYAPAVTTANLFPGEGVYSYSPTSPAVTPTTNIKYEFFSGKNTLLTYNVNTNNASTSAAENGVTTGLRPPANTVISGNSGSRLVYSENSGPFRVGINDVFKMNNNGVIFTGLTLERIFIDE